MTKQRQAISILSLFLILAIVLPALACATTSTPTPTPTKEVKTTPYSETKEAEVSLEDAPVRNGPGAGFTQIGTLKKKTKVIINGISSDGSFFRIQTPAGIDPKGKECWISVIFVAVIQPTMPPMPQMPTSP